MDFDLSELYLLESAVQPPEFLRGVDEEVPTILLIPQEVQHEGDCVHFLEVHCYTQVQKALAVELERTVNDADNPKSYVLT